MKAWFRNCLDPLNLCHQSIAFNFWLLRVYKRWLWKPFLETWLYTKPDHGKKVAAPCGIYTCLQCGEKKNLALAVCNDTELSFFCSISCSYKHGLSAVIDRDAEGQRNSST